MDLRSSLLMAYENHQANRSATATTPADDERRSLARHLGMDPEHEDKHLMWIADLALKSPLPADWNSYETDAGELYFFKPETGESQWDHPNDSFFRTLFRKTKEQENASLKMAEAASLLFRSSLVGDDAMPTVSACEAADLPELPVSPVHRSRSPDPPAPPLAQSAQSNFPSLDGPFVDLECVQQQLEEQRCKIEENRARTQELETSLQAIHEAVRSRENEHKTRDGAVQHATQRLEAQVKHMAARIRNIECKQSANSMLNRLSGVPNDSFRSTAMQSWQLDSFQGADNAQIGKQMKQVQDWTWQKIADTHEQLNMLKRVCRSSSLYRHHVIDRDIFLAIVFSQFSVLVCTLLMVVISAASAVNDTDLANDTAIDALSVLQQVAKGAEGILLLCILDFLYHLLSMCELGQSRPVTPLDLARASLARIVGRVSCIIHVASSLRLAGALVYARKINTNESEALARSSQMGAGLGIVSSYIADRSLDPVGTSETCLIPLCLLLLLVYTRRARCEQVPVFVAVPTFLWALVRFARGAVLIHSMSAIGQQVPVDIKQDNIRGVISSSLQIIESCAGMFAFGAFARCCKREDISPNYPTQCVDPLCGPVADDKEALARHTEIGTSSKLILTNTASVKVQNESCYSGETSLGAKSQGTPEGLKQEEDDVLKIEAIPTSIDARTSGDENCALSSTEDYSMPNMTDQIDVVGRQMRQEKKLEAERISKIERTRKKKTEPECVVRTTRERLQDERVQEPLCTEGEQERKQLHSQIIRGEVRRTQKREKDDTHGGRGRMRQKEERVEEMKRRRETEEKMSLAVGAMSQSVNMQVHCQRRERKAGHAQTQYNGQASIDNLPLPAAETVIRNMSSTESEACESSKIAGQRSPQDKCLTAPSTVAAANAHTLAGTGLAYEGANVRDALVKQGRKEASVGVEKVTKEFASISVGSPAKSAMHRTQATRGNTNTGPLPRYTSNSTRLKAELAAAESAARETTHRTTHERLGKSEFKSSDLQSAAGGTISTSEAEARTARELLDFEKKTSSRRRPAELETADAVVEQGSEEQKMHHVDAVKRLNAMLSRLDHSDIDALRHRAAAIQPAARTHA